jgi:two-component system phosphate regulon sensor histidine kinase PhoR
MRTDFVANVSHELKTPLTSIKGFVETLEAGAINNRKNAKRFLSIIRKHTDRLGKIIDDLLSLSELELRKDSIEKADLNLRSLVDEVVMGFGYAHEVKRQKLDVNSQDGDFRIKADRDKIEQVFVNLVDNAIKYTKEGGHITVSFCPQKEDITVIVEDNGVGIAKEHLDRVFERFYRVDKARSRELGGTGLGLSIAKHIILLHNGKISIESEPGRGTKVFVTLPRE